jgi:thiosulfate reductase cytochrome b subunit
LRRIFRYPLVVRLTHWLTALALLILTMSGMQIFNAHPALYASDASNFDHPVLAIRGGQDAHGQPVGYVQLGNVARLNTTHVLGWGPDGMGSETARAFPAWATIPGPQDLADGRRWHLLFAWVLIACALLFARAAFKLWPTKADFQALPQTLRDHLLPWKVHPGAALNPLQKLTYFAVVFVVTPIVILSGMALSPTIDSWFHWLPAMFGGRQFARIWHFAGMWALILFFVGHVAMVALTGLINNLRSMITGWFMVPGPADESPSPAPSPVESVPT